jgi:hypothetical protein
MGHVGGAQDKETGGFMRVRMCSEWVKYAEELASLHMLGVVYREHGDIGALAQTAAGVYVQVNGALITDLDQQAVAVAIAKAPDQGA